MAKPVLLWREGDTLGGRRPDDFQVMPNAVSERLIEILIDKGHMIFILAWDPEAGDVTIERHAPDV